MGMILIINEFRILLVCLIVAVSDCLLEQSDDYGIIQVILFVRTAP